MSFQPPLFALDTPPPHDPIRLLRDGAALVLSVSGGKDSDAMCHHLLERRQTEGWSDNAARTVSAVQDAGSESGQ